MTSATKPSPPAHANFQPCAGSDEVRVDQYTNGLLDPSLPMLGPVADGGHIFAETAPGCWGPMITPAIRGGHEVTRPVAVAGSEVGDAIAIRIKSIRINSLATSSGNDVSIPGRFLGDPYVAGRCPGCDTLYPKTVVRGIGPSAVRCVNCGADAAPFMLINGYTVCFDDERSIGLTVEKNAAEAIATRAAYFAALPANSIQNPILAFAAHDMPGVAVRLRPFLGQLGTTPSIRLPDSHNAGDFASFLVGAPHEFAISADQLSHRTDGHMDIDAAREGAIVICPVKVAGGGIYLGDMHAMQGDGEIAGHTCDVAGSVVLQVHVIKNLPIDGPVLLPVLEDLPFLARPLSPEEERQVLKIAKNWGVQQLEQSAPISVVGTGANLNEATDNGLARAACLLDLSIHEIKNRATVTGAIEIGRQPGVVQVTFRAPIDRLRQCGLLPFVRDQYGIG